MPFTCPCTCVSQGTEYEWKGLQCFCNTRGGGVSSRVLKCALVASATSGSCSTDYKARLANYFHATSFTSCAGSSVGPSASFLQTSRAKSPRMRALRSKRLRCHHHFHRLLLSARVVLSERGSATACLVLLHRASSAADNGRHTSFSTRARVTYAQPVTRVSTHSISSDTRTRRTLRYLHYGTCVRALVH